MTSHNDPAKSPSVIAKLLNLPATLISRLAWRYCNVNRCEIDGETLILRKGLFTTRIIYAPQIRCWSVHPEMGFDVIRIELENGEVLNWIDKYNDLLDGLRKLAESKYM